MSDDSWVVTNHTFFRIKRGCIIIHVWVSSTYAFSCSSLTCICHIHRPLVFYSSKLQNLNPKSGFEGVQTQNPGLKIVVWIWNQYITDRTEPCSHTHLSSTLIQASRWKRSIAIATMQLYILVHSSVEQISFSQTTSKCFIWNKINNASVSWVCQVAGHFDHRKMANSTIESSRFCHNCHMAQITNGRRDWLPNRGEWSQIRAGLEYGFGVRVSARFHHTVSCALPTLQWSQGGRSSTTQSVLSYLHYGGVKSRWKKFHHTVSSALPTLRRIQGGRSSTIQSVLSYLHYGGFRVEEVPLYSQFCPTYTTADSGWKKFHHTVGSVLPTLQWSQGGRSSTTQSVLPYLHYSGVRVEEVPPHSRFCPTYTTAESGRSPTIQSVLPYLRYGGGVRVEKVPLYSQFCPTYTTVESAWKKSHHTVSSALPTLRWSQGGKSSTIQSVLPYLHYDRVRVEEAEWYGRMLCHKWPTTDRQPACHAPNEHMMACSYPILRWRSPFAGMWHMAGVMPDLMVIFFTVCHHRPAAGITITVTVTIWDLYSAAYNTEQRRWTE